MKKILYLILDVIETRLVDREGKRLGKRSIGGSTEIVFNPSGKEAVMKNECFEVQELIRLYPLGILSLEQVLVVNEHVLFCPDCCVYHVMAVGA